MARSAGFDAAERGCSSTTRPAPLTLRAEPRCDDRASMLAVRLAAGRRHHRAGRFAPDALIVRRRPPAARRRGDGRLVRRAGRGVAAGRAARRRRARRRGCSTRAPRPAARRRPLAAAMDEVAGCLSPATSAIAGVDLLRADRRRDRRRERPLVQADCCSRCPSRRVRLRARRRALLRPRHAAARSGHPVAAAAKRISPALAAARARDAAARRRRGRAGRTAVYATCSSEPEENEDVVGCVSRRRRRFRAPSTRVDATSRCPKLSSTSAATCGRQPDRHGLEAFFGAALNLSQPSFQPDLWYDLEYLMALRTRVWSAGKLLLLAGALRRDLRPLCRGLDAPRAARARGAGSRPHQPHGQRRDGDRQRPRPDAQVDDMRRPDPKFAAGRVLAQDPAAGLDGAAPAQRASLAERRPAIAPTVPALTGETERTAQLRLAQDGLDARRRLSEIRSRRLSRRRRRRADAAGQDRRRAASRCSSTAASAAPVRDARSDRRQRRSRRRNPARSAASASPSSARRRIRASPPASSFARARRRGFQIAPGEPISLEVSR